MKTKKALSEFVIYRFLDMLKPTDYFNALFVY